MGVITGCRPALFVVFYFHHNVTVMTTSKRQTYQIHIAKDKKEEYIHPRLKLEQVHQYAKQNQD